MNDTATATQTVTSISATPFPVSTVVALIFSLAGAFFIGLYILRRIRNKNK